MIRILWNMTEQIADGIRWCVGVWGRIG